MDITPGVRGAPARWGLSHCGDLGKIPPPPGEHEELARDEIAGMVGHDIQKPGFVLGIAQGSDSLDVNVGNFHMFKISGWILVSPTWPAGLRPADHR